MFSVSVDFARLGQTRFRFSRALPAVGKRHFVFVSPCPRRASPFSFFKSLARAGQTCFNFILPLPASGKPVFISNCLIWCIKLLNPNGVLYFSTNSTKLIFDAEKIPQKDKITVTDITTASIPKDFEGTKCHKAWQITLK